METFNSIVLEPLALINFEGEASDGLGDAQAALDDLAVDELVTEMLAFVIIGLTSWIGATWALNWWTGGISLTTWWGAGNLVGAIVYTAGSLFECILWTFALLESELDGFSDTFGLSPFFIWWAPIVEYICLFGYAGVWIMYLLSLLLDTVKVGTWWFVQSIIWWAIHTLAHIFFLEKAIWWAGGTIGSECDGFDCDFEEMPEF